MPVLHTTAVFIGIFRWEKFTGVISNQNQARLVSSWDFLWWEATCQSNAHGGIYGGKFYDLSMKYFGGIFGGKDH